MTNKIGIPIEAQFDTKSVDAGIDKITQKINEASRTQLDPVSDKAAAKVEQLVTAVNKVGRSTAQANKTQYNPVSKDSASNLKNTVSLMQQLLRVDGDLKRRAKAVGVDLASVQSIEDLPMQQMYSSKGAAQRKITNINRYLKSGEVPGGGGGGNNPGSAFGGMAANVAQAGLRAAGPAGGVAAGALGTGMSSGIGAGMAGLVGGMLALGVGKAVSGVMEKMDQAESNAIAYDKLKRVLGDVNVSFNGLKAAVEGGAKNLRITFDESARLSTQFSKMANLSSKDYKSLPGELATGVGLSRAFGMDPSQGVGAMGQMRGLGVTKDVQDSRRFAILIGETIGKAGAFAKADEVMDAMTAYATQQTRSSMGGANVSGYAGALSSLVGSGIPGMDPAGAASLLSRINSTLSAGGAKGEASQFFTGQVGHRMGLNPLQTQVMREGGAFATNDKMFGEGSAYQRYMGKTGPKGGATFLQGTVDMLNQQYKGDDDQSKLLRAQAFANHAGVNMNQAMGLLSVKPNQMGEMEKYAGDLTKMSGSGIGNLSKALYGTAGDRQDLAKGYLGRKGSDAISSQDAKDLNDAKGNDAALRDVLGRIAGKYDQERTQGSDIRDSKNTLDNILTAMAGELIPITQQIRHGIMYMAGAKDGKSPLEVMKDVLRLESKDKITRIDAEYDPKTQALRNKRSELSGKIEQLSETRLTGSAMYMGKPELVEQKRRERLELERQMLETDTQLRKLSEEKAELLKKEAEELKKGIDGLLKTNTEKAAATAPASSTPYPAANATNESPAERNRLIRHGSRGSGAGGAALDTGAIDEKLAEAEKKNNLPKGIMKSVMQQETGGKQAYLTDPAKYHYPLNADGRRIAPHTGKVSTAFGPFGILESTAAKPGYGVAPLKDKSIDEQIRFSSEYLAARSKSAGSVEAGLSGYGEGPAYGRSVMNRVKKSAGTPIPENPGRGSAAAYESLRITSDPIIVRHENDRGEQVMPAQTIQTKVGPAQPFGAGRS